MYQYDKEDSPLGEIHKSDAKMDQEILSAIRLYNIVCFHEHFFISKCITTTAKCHLLCYLSLASLFLQFVISLTRLIQARIYKLFGLVQKSN